MQHKYYYGLIILVIWVFCSQFIILRMDVFKDRRHCMINYCICFYSLYIDVT